MSFITDNSNISKYISNNINYDKDNILLARENITNEYSFVNPHHAFKSTIDFLEDNKDKHTLELQFYDVSQYISRYHYENSENYQFRVHKLYIKSTNYNCFNIIIHINNHKQIYKNITKKVLLNIANTINNKCKIKLLNIITKKNRNNNSKIIKLYLTKLYHITSKNIEIHNTCANRINKAWKNYKNKEKIRNLVIHKKIFKNVLNEINYLPNGGYNGNIITFKGGKLYKKAKKHYMKIAFSTKTHA